MSGRFVLRRDGRLFGDWLTTLLNGTVCTGARLSFEYDKKRERVRLTTGNRPLPLHTGPRRKPSTFLDLDYLLSADDSGRFLAVQSSFIGLYVGPATRPVVHYDYERDKPGGYPEAHIQIHATSGQWATLLERDLHKLHFTSGDRRFRPTLEDFIEFLVVEEIVEAHTGWERLIEEGRARYRDIQLRASMRADQDTAYEVMRDLDQSA